MGRNRSLRGRAAGVARRAGLAAGVGTLGLGGLVLFGPVDTPAASLAAQVALHPNHFASHPGGTTSSTVGWASSNWSGYAITGSAYTSITGHWSVPSVSPSSGATYSAAWAGIDGFNNSSLIQTGTEQDYYSGAPHYAAWWTTSAQSFAEQPISEPVSPGDPMSATISESNASTSSWTITLTDGSTAHGWSFTKTLTYTGPGTSAEWIMEAPTVGGRVATLAHYQSPTTFDPGTVNGASPALVTSNGGELVVRSRGHNTVVSIPSVPDSEVDGFNISYGSSAPLAPAS
jgi:Peptidase A4 family